MAIDLNDKTTNGNNLTNVSGTEVTTSLPFAASSIAVDLEEDNSAYLHALDSISLSITGNLTIECWVKFESLAQADSRSPFVTKWNDNAVEDRSYEFGYWNESGTPKIRLAYSTDGTYQAANDIKVDWTPSLATWYHTAVVFTAATPKIQFFVDGSQQGADQTPSGTSIFNGVSRLQIGSSANPPTVNQFFDGVIDDVRIWNITRTGTQINNNRSVELVGNEAGLVAYYPFEVLSVGSVRPETLSNQQRYTKIAKSTSKTFIRLSDQLVEKLGTSRMSEVVAKIGNTGEPKEKIINDWCNSL